MASVLNHKADVVVTGKVNGSHNIGTAGNIDSVVREVTKRASLALSREGIASLVGKEHLHHRGGRVKARDGISPITEQSQHIQVRYETYWTSGSSQAFCRAVQAAAS